MKSWRTILRVTGVILTVAASVRAGDIKIIANASVKADSISEEDLRRIFLLQMRTLKDGSSVHPVLQKDGVTHKAFVTQYLDRDAAEIHTYYQGLVFTGKGSMPKELNSDSEVVAYVLHVRGAIGYVSDQTDTATVKVVAVVGRSGRAGQRILLRRVEPGYPEALRKRGIQGVVRLRLTISPEGSVETVLVLGGNPILAEVAVKAVKQWVYSPAASETTTEISIPFDGRR
jgi:TonB family protein